MRAHTQTTHKRACIRIQLQPLAESAASITASHTHTHAEAPPGYHHNDDGLRQTHKHTPHTFARAKIVIGMKVNRLRLSYDSFCLISNVPILLFAISRSLPINTHQTSMAHTYAQCSVRPAGAEFIHRHHQT